MEPCNVCHREKGGLRIYDCCIYFLYRILVRKELVLKRRGSVKQLAQERKHKLLSSKVLHQFLWDVNEVSSLVLLDR